MRRTATIVGLALALQVPTALRAQVRGSERAEVSQTVDGTRVTVNYSRPRLRGRRNVFGTQVPWGEIWTPGANSATKLTVSKDVMIEGHAVPKGSYSVWIPMTRGEWTLVLDPDTTLFHVSGPKERAGQIRFPVRKVAVPLTDVLTWSFPALKISGMRLVMQWETTSVPLEIVVTPTQELAVDPALGRRLEGCAQEVGRRVHAGRSGRDRTAGCVGLGRAGIRDRGRQGDGLRHAHDERRGRGDGEATALTPCKQLQRRTRETGTGTGPAAY